MYLSSRFTACIGIVACFGVGMAHAALAARPAFIGVHPGRVSGVPHLPYSGIAPTLVGRQDRYPADGLRPTLVSPGRRFHAFGYGGYGLDGYDIGYDGIGADDYGAAGVAPPALGPIGAPPPFAVPVLPAPCPQIIEIGGGLAHKATTHVVSGSPCRRR